MTELCCCCLFRHSIYGATLTTHRHLDVEAAEVVAGSTGLSGNLSIVAAFGVIGVVIIYLEEIFTAAENVESSD